MLVAGYAEVTVEPNLPPWSGQMKISPIGGTTGATRYSFTLEGFVDDIDSYPLRFAFAYATPIGVDVPITMPSYRNHYAVMGLPNSARCEVLGQNLLSCNGMVKVKGYVYDALGTVHTISGEVATDSGEMQAQVEENVVMDWVKTGLDGDLDYYGLHAP